MASNQCTHPTANDQLVGRKTSVTPSAGCDGGGQGFRHGRRMGLRCSSFRVPGAIGLAAVVDRIINEEDGGDSFQP